TNLLKRFVCSLRSQITICGMLGCTNATLSSPPAGSGRASRLNPKPTTASTTANGKPISARDSHQRLGVGLSSGAFSWLARRLHATTAAQPGDTDIHTTKNDTP